MFEQNNDIFPHAGDILLLGEDKNLQLVANLKDALRVEIRTKGEKITKFSWLVNGEIVSSHYITKFLISMVGEMDKLNQVLHEIQDSVQWPIEKTFIAASSKYAFSLDSGREVLQRGLVINQLNLEREVKIVKKAVILKNFLKSYKCL